MQGWLLRLAAPWLAALVLAACGQSAPAQDADGLVREPLVIETAAGVRHAFRVEIAATPEERSQGLMFRTSMAADAGMLFQYTRPQYITMWMANTILPLDMLFIAADGRILNIAARTVPQSRETIPSAAPAVGVLELNGGSAARLGIAAGDLVRHPFFGTAD